MNPIKWFKRLLGHSYFNRIFYLSISTLIILVVISSLSYYLYIDRSVSKNKYETDMDMLMQIEKNFENTNNLTINILENLYEDRRIREIMDDKSDDLDWETIEPKLQDISSDMKIFSPYIHSIYNYNNSGRNVYASYTDTVSDVIDMYLYKTINNFDQVPQLTPILRKVKTNNPNVIEYIDVFTYFICDTKDDGATFDKALIINVDPKWFLDNFYKINPDENVRYYLMASNREFVNVDNNMSFKYFIDLTDVYYREIVGNIKNGNTFGMIPCYLDGTKNLLSYIYLENEGFIIYKIQTYSSVYASVNQMKLTVIIIAGFIVLIALFLALLMAKHIYKPFDKFVKSISSYSGYKSDNYGQFDELLFLENSYIHSVDEISLLRREVNSADNIKYKYYLTQLLINSNTVTESEITEIRNSGLFNVDVNSTLMMIMIKLNSTLSDESASWELGAWIKGMINKSLSLHYVNDVIDLENSSIVAILNTKGQNDEEKHKTILYKEVLEIQQEMYNKYGFSFAVAISSPVNSVNKLSDVYFMLKSYLSYSYIYGDTAIITNELIENNLRNTSLKYPFSDEKKLVSAIKRQDYDMVKQYMDSIITKFKVMSYNNIIISLVHLCNTVRTTINELNKANYSSDYVGIYDINPVDYQTIDNLLQVLMELIESSSDVDTTTQKHVELVRTVKGIVCDDYTDPNLNLPGIADKIKISPNYLNCIFKNISGCSVADFITDYRLSKAAELLKETEESVNSIMYRVGIENASTFYRCFKSKFGTTPKNYIIASLHEQAVENN